MSHRLFIALRPPPKVREALKPLLSGVEGARWLNDNQLHLTLAFLGEVDKHGVDAALLAMETVQAPQLELHLGQLGSFDATGPGKTSALWIGVEPAEPLADLATSFRTACRRAGLAPDARKFIPHITLARFGSAGATSEAIRPWLETASLPAISWRNTSFHLVESILGESGPHYEPLASYELQSD
jgi:2'-5' RNA ligase